MVPYTIATPPGVTTTMSWDEYQMWLKRQPKATTEPESWGEDILDSFLWPILLVPLFCCGIGASIAACWYFGKDTWENFNKALFGSRRYLTLFKQDIVHKFAPDDPKTEWDELPPRITREDILRMEADEKATEDLEYACKMAFAKGRHHLVSVHFSTGPGPQQEAIAVERAVAIVRARGLQDTGNNAYLIEEGLAWANTLHMETQIVEAIDKAFPILTVDFKNLTKAPVPGAPWAATTVGHAMTCDKRREVWQAIEELAQSIKTCTEGGASEGLVDQGNELLAELIARTPELPQDRCVLDPAGKGVKLLPKGRQRALWYHTGDAYLYDPETETAGKLNDFELPPRDMLRDTSVKSARPVCSVFAKTKNCSLGKRCPWRHCKPVKGDTVREPIMSFEDVEGKGKGKGKDSA